MVIGCLILCWLLFVRFSFLTGVSKFTKVSVFSELNNLTDLTLDRGHGEPIHRIGVEFSRRTRNVTAFEVADG